MESRIKLYGGPMHGETVLWDESSPRLYLKVPRDVRHRLLNRDWWRTDGLMPTMDIHECSYYRERYQMQMGMGLRTLWVGLYEGAKLNPKEQYELHYEFDAIPWQPAIEISFLHNFDMWFAWTAYKYTGDERLIREYLQEYRCEVPHRRQRV